MSRDDYDKGFDYGYKAHKDEMAANYDQWRRARVRRDMTGTTYDLQDLAVRQVIYGNEHGKRTDEKDKTET